MMIKTKKDEINEIKSLPKSKSRDIVTQKLAIVVQNSLAVSSSIRLLCCSSRLRPGST